MWKQFFESRMKMCWLLTLMFWNEHIFILLSKNCFHEANIYGKLQCVDAFALETNKTALDF